VVVVGRDAHPGRGHARGHRGRGAVVIGGASGVVVVDDHRHRGRGHHDVVVVGPGGGVRVEQRGHGRDRIDVRIRSR
jgi:hypothetical protein